MEPTLPTIGLGRACSADESLRLLYVLFEPLGHIEGFADVMNKIIVGGEECVNVKLVFSYGCRLSL
jgi:hypothetical protein